MDQSTYSFKISYVMHTHAHTFFSLLSLCTLCDDHVNYYEGVDRYISEVKYHVNFLIGPFHNINVCTRESTKHI